MYSYWSFGRSPLEFCPNSKTFKEVSMPIFRNCLLFLNAIALTVGALIYIQNVYSLLFFRMLQGFVVGAYSAISPLLIN
jgi:hypothetical protein